MGHSCCCVCARRTNDEQQRQACIFRTTHIASVCEQRRACVCVHGRTCVAILLYTGLNEVCGDAFWDCRLRRASERVSAQCQCGWPRSCEQATESSAPRLTIEKAQILLAGCKIRAA
eukprot:2230630-Pleurochrysis_carterae.AAC.1